MKRPKLLIIILDGASADVMERAETSFIDKVCKESGIGMLRASAPVPTITYVNHSTIMTGRMPGGKGGHGIVGNLFHDTSRDRIVNVDDYDLSSFIEAPNLFELLQSASNSRFYFASVAEPASKSADIIDPMKQFFTRLPMERDRIAVEHAMKIIKRHNPDAVVVNFLAVDAAGENYGPQTSRYRAIIEEADNHIRKLMNIWHDISRQEVHLIITSDHGMHMIDKSFDVEKALEKAGVAAGVAASHRAAHIYLHDAADLDKAKECMLESGAFAEVYSKKQLPSISMDHERSGDLFLLAGEGVELQKPGLKGSHGSNRPEETEVPLILGGSAWESVLPKVLAGRARPWIGDVTPLALELFRK